MTDLQVSSAVELLDGLAQRVEAALHSALLVDGEQGGDDFTSHCGELSRSLKDGLPIFGALLESGVAIPTSFRVKLQALQTRLQLLQQTHAQLAATNQQAMDVIFPSDQVKAYSRLGQKSGRMTLPGSRHFTA